MKAPTVFGKIHMWLGKLILLLAVVNGIMYVPHPSVARLFFCVCVCSFFLMFFMFSSLVTNTCRSGFTFALKGLSAIVFGVLVIIFTAATLFFGRMRLFKKSQQFQHVGTQQSHPWRQSSTYNAGYSSGPPPGYEPPSQQVGLEATGSSSHDSPWKSNNNKGYEDESQLGSTQRPREFA